MFWSTLALEERDIDRKLKSEDLDLKSILEDIHCLQEIRNSNEQLMKFLRRDDNFRTMLEAILRPCDSDAQTESESLKDKYRFMHQCCEALCIGAREFSEDLGRHQDLAEMMMNFLGNDFATLNPLVVSLYGRVALSFLCVEPVNERFITMLEESRFLENCIHSLENCSLFELLCSMVNCKPDSAFRERIKRWYLNREFIPELLKLLNPNHPSSVHENASSLWVEFIKSLREYQYNVEQSADPLLESSQSEENINDLLKLMFPLDAVFSASIVANGVSILNALLETNQIRNSPSFLLAQELQGTSNSSLIEHQNYSFNSTDTDTNPNTSSQLLMDPNRIVESHSAEHASDIMKCVTYALSDHEFGGDVLTGCMQLLINLSNTNFLPTHLELLRIFSSPETSLAILFQHIEKNPSHSVFNAQLTTLILHILYSNTGTQRPLIDFIIKEFNLPSVIRNALSSNLSLETNDLLKLQLSSKMYLIAKRSFFLHLANRLIRSQQSSPNADYIDEQIKGLPDYEDWVEFCANSVQLFVEQNRSEKVNSISTNNRTSNTIEIDELPDDNLLTLSPIKILD